VEQLRRLAYGLIGWILVVVPLWAGEEVLQPSPPSTPVSASPRIVSLDLCTDWMLLRHGLPGQAVIYSPLLYRYATDWTPPGSPTHDGRLETLLRLGPARLLTGQYNARMLRQRLQQLGRDVTVLPLPQSLDQLEEYLRRFERAVGWPAGRVAGERKGRAEHEKRSDPQPRPRLLLLGANGIATGSNTLEDEMIRRAGWRNWLDQPGFVTLDIEAVLRDPPDAILWSQPDSPALANRFARMPPIRRLLERQPPFPASDGDWRWHCPGPWTLDLIDDLARWWEAFDGA